MSNIYELRSTAKSNGKTHYWGAKNSLAEAEALQIEKTSGEKKAWADQHHTHWRIEAIDTTGLFEIPTLPKPRERFTASTTLIQSSAGTWNTLSVAVADTNRQIVARYDRNYPNMYQTFEPFRQGDKMFALISQDYTATSVIDLASGKIIATERASAGGFCPVGFYVPDWWDLNGGATLPGSSDWTAAHAEPKGDYGFVWGCIWGDDSSWKVQYLDLSEIQSGEIIRDSRFGYVELATNVKLAPHDFIHCYIEHGKRKVKFSVLAHYDIKSGQREANEFELDNE